MDDSRSPRQRSWRGLSFLGLVLFTPSVLLIGCSDIQRPTAAQAITHPFGTAAPFTRGTPKAKVLEFWGKPDHVIPHGVDELGNAREEWIYTGRLQSLPIDYEYVSRTKHLFFEGDNLVRWTSEESPAAAK